MSESPAAQERRLVLISGPVASGKTTLALNLAQAVRGQGLRAAAIDMDEVTAVVAGPDWSAVAVEDRVIACGVAAAMVDRLFGQGTTAVFVAGSTLSAWEWDELLEALERDVPAVRVLLRVTLKESQRRAAADPGRVITNDPDVVAALYTRIDWEGLTPADIELETDDLEPEDVASVILELLPLVGG